MPTKQLDNQVSLVAGGGSGLGRASALMLAKQGSNVIIADLDGEKAQSVAAEVEAIGQLGLAVQVDTTVKTQVIDLIDTALEKFLKVDIMVNCVGVAYRSSVVDFPEDKWRWVIDTCLTSMLFLCQAVLPPMMDQRYGRIVNIASRAAYKGRPNTAAYTAAKGGMVAMARVVAEEAAPYGINVNSIAPGTTETPLVARIMGEEEMLSEADRTGVITTPSRLAKPDEQAAAILYLVGPHSAHITGQVLHVNGGSYMP